MTDKLIIITGPTASGKSDIAINIAGKINGQIVSADSQQVYREMDIGTNKVDDFTIDHHMINIVSPDEDYSVEDFKNESRILVKKINDIGNIPILVGGTGFYIDSLLFDMNYGKVEKDYKLRNELENLSKVYGHDYLYKKLKKIDPDTAKKYHPNELNRVIRALEIYKITGEKPSVKRKGANKLNKAINPILFFLNYEDRKSLYEKINKRVLRMLDLGLEDEFKYLVEKYNLTEDSKSMAAIGYKEFFQYFKGDISKDELVRLIQRNTRRYAKRQVTWMKKYRDYPFCHEIIMDNLSKEDAGMIIESILKDVYGV